MLSPFTRNANTDKSILLASYSALHYCCGQLDLVAAASITTAAPDLLESADEDGKQNLALYFAFVLLIESKIVHMIYHFRRFNASSPCCNTGEYSASKSIDSQ